MTLRDLTWARRTLVVLVLWVVLSLIMEWLLMDPDWIGTLAAAAAVAALSWFIADHVPALEAPAWQTEPPGLVRKPPADGRMGALRRVVNQTTDPPPRPDQAPSSAPTQLQTILLDVTAGRLRAQHSTTGDETAVDVVRRLGPGQDPHLAAYLLSVPAPQLDDHELNDLLSRIEAL
ncbi:hypothetical protein [Luteipulveratus mongoliensis]|uniref:hypothetical protein n=1 Tax=Luteipulveratus mongoliensis TaxID=571913 RepID=UPI000696E10D|nr:hypothetical protein [Luteipulveratus mongoliensis]